MPAKPLTAKEKAWIKEVEAVLARCPSTRLNSYTIGDAEISLYDKPVADAWEQANGYPQLDAGQIHERAGSFLGVINFPFQIDSCAG